MSANRPSGAPPHTKALHPRPPPAKSKGPFAALFRLTCRRKRVLLSPMMCGVMKDANWQERNSTPLCFFAGFSFLILYFTFYIGLRRGRAVLRE